MSTGLKANSDGSAAIQVGGTDVITLTSGGAATFVTSPTTVQAGTAAAPSITFSGDTNTGIYSPGADTIAFTEGGVESMRIDSSGNVGIGTTSPTNPLQVNGNIVTTDGTTVNRMTRSGGVGLFGTTSNHPIAFQTNDTERIRLDASGNLGIGTSSPLATLEINRNTTSGTSTAYPNVRLDNQNAAGYTGLYFYQAGTSKAFFEVKNDVGALTMGTGSTERARITSGGFFKVSTTGAYVNSAVYHEFTNSQNDWIVWNRNTAASPAGLRVNFSGAAPNGTANEFLFCNDTSATRATIRSNGGLANYSANNVNLSDRREKTNFAPAKNYLDVICAIPVQTFNYIDQSEDDPGETLGVVAQDVQAVAPEMVMESNWGTEENPKMRLSIYQTDLQYALMKSIQELKAIVDAQAAEIAALKGNA